MGQNSEMGRKDIEKGIENTDKKYEKSAKEFEKDVKTQTAVGEVGKQSKLGGTTEGMRDFKKHVEDAGKATEKKFTDDKRTLEGVVKDEAKPMVERMDKASQETKEDIGGLEKKIKQAEVEQAARALEQAKGKLKEDADFTERVGKKQKDSTTKAEQNEKKAGDAMSRNKLSWKK